MGFRTDLQTMSARERERHESIICLHWRSCSTSLRNSLLGRNVRVASSGTDSVARDHPRALVGNSPLEPEIAFRTRSRVCRDDRDEQRAVADLLADLQISDVAAAHLALIEPDLNA